MTQSDPKSSNKPSRGKKRLGLGLGLIVFLAILTSLGLYSYYLWNASPSQWQTEKQHLAQMPQQEILTKASALQDHLLYEITKPQTINETNGRAILVPYEWVNAWLSQKLTPWIEGYFGYKMPQELDSIMVMPQNDQIIVAVAIDKPDFKQVFSAYVKILLKPNGKMTAQLVALRGGRLPLPVNYLLSQIPSLTNISDPILLTNIKSLSNGLEFDPTFPIDPRRTARIIDLQIKDDFLLIRVKQENRTPQQTASYP